MHAQGGNPWISQRAPARRIGCLNQCRCRCRSCILWLDRGQYGDMDEGTRGSYSPHRSNVGPASQHVNQDLYNRYPRLQISSFQKILLVPLEFLFRTGVTAGPSHVFPTNTTPPTYTSLISDVFLSTFSLCQPLLSQKVRGMHSTIRL